MTSLISTLKYVFSQRRFTYNKQFYLIYKDLYTRYLFLNLL